MSDYLWHSVGLVLSVWQVVTILNYQIWHPGMEDDQGGNHKQREKGESLSATPTAAAAWGINKCSEEACWICPQLSQHRFFSRRGNDDCTNSNVSVKKGIYSKGTCNITHTYYFKIHLVSVLFQKAKGAIVLRIFTCLNSRLCFYSSANHTCCHLMREVRHKMAIHLWFVIRVHVL